MLEPAFESEDSVRTLRMIALSGEGVVGADLRRWFARHREDPEIVDTYAITETGGQVAWRNCGSSDAESTLAICWARCSRIRGCTCSMPTSDRSKWEPMGSSVSAVQDWRGDIGIGQN